MEGIEQGYLTGTSRFKCHQGEGTFRTASIDAGEMTLWVIIVIWAPWPDVRSSPVSDRDSDLPSGL
jgi:hypothetical protein